MKTAQNSLKVLRGLPERLSFDPKPPNNLLGPPERLNFDPKPPTNLLGPPGLVNRRFGLFVLRAGGFRTGEHSLTPSVDPPSMTGDKVVYTGKQ